MGERGVGRGDGDGESERLGEFMGGCDCGKGYRSVIGVSGGMGWIVSLGGYLVGCLLGIMVARSWHGGKDGR